MKQTFCNRFAWWQKLMTIKENDNVELRKSKEFKDWLTHVKRERVLTTEKING